MISYSTVVRRALVAGVVAGLLGAIFVGLVAEDSIDAAIAIEDAAAAAAQRGDGPPVHVHDDPLFTRSQQVVGGLAASVVFGAVLGLVFGTVFAFVRHRLTVADDVRRVLLLAAVGFAATALLPALKYPANPPAVGDPDTVNLRTVYYLTFLVGCLALATAIGTLYRRLAERVDRATALAAAATAAAVGVVAVLVVWPSNPDSVPGDFPAQLLWDFRVESVTTLAIVWASLGLVMAWLSRPRVPSRV